jgi:exopolysaccharide biosynthesis polyprenyl glycosylphosphotransferase
MELDQTVPPVAVSSSATERESFAPARIQQRRKRLMWRFTGWGWFINDVVATVTGVVLAFLFSPQDHFFNNHPEVVGFFPFAIALSLLVGVIAHVAALHDPRYPRRWTDVVGRSLFVVATALTLVTLELLFVHFIKVGRYIIVFSGLFTVLGMVSSRLIVWHLSRSFAQTVCFLGDDRFCFNASTFLDERPLPFKTKSILDFAAEKRESLSEWSIDEAIDEIVYDPSSYKDDESLLECLDQGIKISPYSDFVEDNYHMVPVEEIRAEWLFSARLELAHPYYHGLKRVVDLLAGLCGLVLSAPIMMVAMILIKYESPGPAVYSQIRVGQFGRRFRIYKLRTMFQDAEKNGAQWAKHRDGRITRLGRFLRKTRLDEAPQFWNIVKGDMSLVGPRPERPEFVDQLRHRIPFFVQRHLVKPGLTGWAQINYPYGASIEDTLNKLKYDLFYIKRASVGLDAQIILRTIGAMMKGSR